MKCLKGNPVSGGIAIGTVYIYRPFQCDVSESHINAGDEQIQIKRYEGAVDLARAELDAIIERLTHEDTEKAKIFVAHKELLSDEEIDEEIRSAIEDEHAMPEYAVYKVYTRFARLLSKAPDPLIAARTADLADICNRLLRILNGQEEKNLSMLPRKVVVVAHDILPSDTATLDRSKVLGIVTEVGGATSHSGIIARSYRIPSILGVSNATSLLQDGDECIVDALNGAVYDSPDQNLIDIYIERQKDFLAAQRLTDEFSEKPAVLKSGEGILIGLNIGSTENAAYYRQCDFVGLLRTEFLYMHNDHLPTEEEQYRAYTRILSNADGRPVILRTLDIGGDKTLDYMSLPKEDNPFLGNRALRFCFANPEIFNVQLRAALRSSAAGSLRLMFPMVATIDDIRRARQMVDQAKAELRSEGKAFDENIPLGIMIEIPAIAEIADMAAQEVDFASVGTNDLTQYMHAVDRMNSDVADYYQSFSPAMLRILGRIFTAFNAAGKPISVCGELGGDPLAVIVLVGLGLKKTSMSGSNIAKVKQILSRFTLSQVQEIAQKVCEMPTQAEIVAYLKQVCSQY